MFNVSSYISRGGRKERKVITLLLTLALEGSQLHATEDAEMTNGKRKNVDCLMFNVYRTQNTRKAQIFTDQYYFVNTIILIHTED